MQELVSREEETAWRRGRDGVETEEETGERRGRDGAGLGRSSNSAGGDRGRVVFDSFRASQ